MESTNLPVAFLQSALEHCDEEVVPHWLCHICTDFTSKLKYLSLSVAESEETYSKSISHVLEHYANIALLIAGADEMCHWCNLLISPTSGTGHFERESMRRAQKTRQLLEDRSLDLRPILW